MNLKHFWQEFFLHESIHITMFFSVLATFFFLYVTKKEEDGIVIFILDALNIRKPNPTVNLIKPYIDALDDDQLLVYKNNSQKSYSARIKKNNKLIQKTIYLILIIAAIFIIINLALYFSSPRDYVGMPKKILIMNILGVLLLGCIEFIFFTQIVIHYQQLTTDELYMQLISHIKSLPKLQNNPQAEQIQFEMAKQLLSDGVSQDAQYNIPNNDNNSIFE